VKFVASFPDDLSLTGHLQLFLDNGRTNRFDQTWSESEAPIFKGDPGF